jgi:hypothetical protein
LGGSGPLILAIVSKKRKYRSDLTKSFFSMNDYEDYESSKNGSFSFVLHYCWKGWIICMLVLQNWITGIIRHEDSPKTQTDFRFVVEKEK